MASKLISFNLNGRPTEALAKPLTTLQSLLRDQMDLTATKSGCRQGGCGSCTVLVDGEPMLSCLLPVEDIQGRQVTTLEGVTPAEGLDTIQETFHETFAIQCGYCTPGMILVAKALLDKNPHPTRQEVVESLTGNYCRCTGYEPIIQAILESANRMNGRKS
jgi:carbon-monoxide dehydrogenase small subunit